MPKNEEPIVIQRLLVFSLLIVCFAAWRPVATFAELPRTPRGELRIVDKTAVPGWLYFSYTTYVGRLSRSLLQAPEVAFDVPYTTRSNARHEALQLWASSRAMLRHR